MPKAAHVRKNLAMILYYFASKSEYRMIANPFGVSQTFLCNSIKDVSCAIIKSLQGRPLYIPKSDELKASLET